LVCAEEGRSPCYDFGRAMAIKIYGKNNNSEAIK
jgi:hypothetical protein